MWKKQLHSWKIFHAIKATMCYSCPSFTMGASHHWILWEKQLTETNDRKPYIPAYHTYLQTSSFAGDMDTRHRKQTSHLWTFVCKSGMWEKIESEALWEDCRVAHQCVKDQQYQVLATSGEQEAFQIPVIYYWNGEKEVAGSSKACV